MGVSCSTKLSIEAAELELLRAKAAACDAYMQKLAYSDPLSRWRLTDALQQVRRLQEAQR